MIQRTFEWQKYVFEVITIFVGITLTLLADGWKEEVADRKREAMLLRQLRENLAADEVYLRGEILILEKVIGYNTIFLNPQENSWIADSSDTYSRMIQLYSTFPFNATAYQMLRENNNGHLISNLKLLGKIIRLYEKDYFDLKEYNNIDRNLILDRLMPHIEASFTATDDLLHPANRQALRASKFRNIVYNSQRFKQIQVRLYEHQLPVIRELIREVDEEIKRLE
jgi:hypothetical protein